MYNTNGAEAEVADFAAYAALETTLLPLNPAKAILSPKFIV
jgi:hypothetical protein